MIDNQIFGTNYNGESGLQVIVSDGEFDDTLDIPIYIDQRNDPIKPFSLFPSLGDYSLVPSTIDSVREVLFFRLRPVSKWTRAIIIAKLVFCDP